MYTKICFSMLLILNFTQAYCMERTLQEIKLELLRHEINIEILEKDLAIIQNMPLEQKIIIRDRIKELTSKFDYSIQQQQKCIAFLQKKDPAYQKPTNMLS